MHCWDRVRLQLRPPPDCSMGVMPLEPVLASAPTQKLPSGLYNFVLVRDIPGLEVVCLQGTLVLLFNLTLSDNEPQGIL